MAKRWIVLLLAAALALAVVPLAASGNGGGGKGKLKFNLVGTVVGVAAPDSTVTPATPGMLTVKVKAGTKTVRAFRGADLKMNVAPAARVRLVIGEGCVDGTLADLVQGMKVKVRGRIDRTTDPATFIAVWIKAKTMPAPEPSSAPLSPAP